MLCTTTHKTPENKNVSKKHVFLQKNDEPNDNTWDWSPSEPPPINLQDKINELEKEKHELQNQLEQLDAEHQQNLTELMTIKEKLQEENERLKEQNSRLNKQEVEELSEKLQAAESRNRDLQQDLTKTSQLIQAAEVKSKEDAENCQKLAFILETYEKQVNSLKEELKQQAELVHHKYVNIISQNAKRYIDAEESPPETSQVEEDSPHLVQFSHQVENIFKILLEFKEKSYGLEQDLIAASNEKTRILNEKYEEIEKLIQNSELLSQEVLKKDETIKELETELRHLITNNDELLTELSTFKNSGLQTISESNEDSMVLLESDLENATKRIKELEQIIDSPVKTVKDASYQDLLNSFDQLKLDYDETVSNFKEATLKIQKMEIENEELRANLEKTRSELENIDYQLSESNFSLDEMEKLEQENKTLKLANMNMIDLKTELNDVREKWMNEENSRRQLETTVKILTEKQQNSKVSETSLKVQLDTLNKEHASVVEARNSLETILESTKTSLEEYKTNYTELLHKYDDVLLRCEELNTAVHLKESELSKLRELDTEELQKQLQELTTSRNELINMVQIKHQESLSYHQEIQRLTAVLAEETQKKQQLEAKLLQTCEDLARKNEEIDKLQDENNFLKEECQVLRVKVAESNGPSEKEQSLSKQLERLQSHLMEMQERHTQEMLQAEQRSQELQAKAIELEQREKSSSTMYTSVSIRANQQVEALQNQLQMANNQKEEARKRVSELEDLNNKQAAALANLQFVLEQFQKGLFFLYCCLLVNLLNGGVDKEKDVHTETERIRRQIVLEKQTQEELRRELDSLRGQLEESKVGLQAASRLSDQLELVKKSNTGLKDESMFSN